eukprot:1440215-Prymnesium_polylepis.1
MRARLTVEEAVGARALHRARPLREAAQLPGGGVRREGREAQVGPERIGRGLVPRPANEVRRVARLRTILLLRRRCHCEASKVLPCPAAGAVAAARWVQ